MNSTSTFSSSSSAPLARRNSSQCFLLDSSSSCCSVVTETSPPSPLSTSSLQRRRQTQKRPQTAGKQSTYQKRVRFTLFLKILLTRLEKAGQLPLLNRAREIVAYCSKRNKMGDPDYAELVESLEVPLRKLVGEVHWIRTHHYMRYYLHDVAPGMMKNLKADSNKSSRTGTSSPIVVLQSCQV